MNLEPSSPASLRTLLIADDQTSILVTLEFVLAGTCRVVRAENGAQAVAVATETAVDGALIDLHMPGMNGIETCRKLRALAAETGRACPVWLMSAAASSDVRRVAAEAGACGFFAKPFPSDFVSQLAAGLSSPSGPCAGLVMRITPTHGAAGLAVPVAPRPLRILCAEDHAQMADVLQHFLQRAGHRPERVEDGQQALERISAEPTAFDLLITDHQMPRLTGLGLVSKLRDTAFAGPVIVFSSILTDAEVDAFRALAVDYILTKPTHMDALLGVLHAISARAV